MSEDKYYPYLKSKYLADHQVTALRKLANGKILWGGVGTGKSRVAAVYYKLNEAPKRVYVITTAKKRNSLDWEGTFYGIDIGPATGPLPIPPAGSKRRRGKAEHQSQGSEGPVSGRQGDQTGRPSTLLAGDQLLHVGGDGRDDSSGLSGEESRQRQAGATLVGDVAAGGSASGSTARVLPAVDAGGSHRRVRGSEAAGAVLGESAGAGEPGVYPWALTVDSWNNLNKYAEVQGAFFIFDEQRLVGSGLWTKAFLRISRRNNWILLSATPGDSWMDYVPVFVANNFYKNRTEFKREHVVYNTFTKFPKVDRYINVGRLARHRSQLLVEMPYVRHTRRRHVEVPLPYEKETLDLVLKKRWHVYEERPLRDVGEMFLVARRVVNSHPSRLEMVCELWKTHPKLIVFYNFDYELASLRSLKEYYGISGTGPIRIGTPERLDDSLVFASPTDATAVDHGRTKISTQTSPLTESHVTGVGRGSKWTTSTTGLPKSSIDRSLSGNERSGNGSSTATVPESHAASSTMSIAEWNGHKHDEIPTTDRWLYLVQYIAGAEAWECISTDAMIKYSKTYSWKTDQQAEGRIDRLNTPFTDLWYYEFTSDSFVDKAIQRSLNAKEDFNASAYGAMFRG